ncbi:hypothetical protein PV325_010467 [Microctonus aethiopoides]|nr:hypothetical protein PV325_010467 [Microctonus aethiopoides]
MGLYMCSDTIDVEPFRTMFIKCPGLSTVMQYYIVNSVRPCVEYAECIAAIALESSGKLSQPIKIEEKKTKAESEKGKLNSSWAMCLLPRAYIKATHMHM